MTDRALATRLIALTRDLILIPSTAERPEDRQRCVEFVRNHLEDTAGVGITEHLHRGVPSLVALPAGVTRPEVLLCGHLDVIAHADVGCYRSEIRDGRIVGPGAGDMKGALAILLDVFREVHCRAPGVSLGLVVTSDEETGGASGLGHLVGSRGLRCGTAMIPDGGSLREITVAEKGILHLRVQTAGTSAHAARPWRGDNPIERLMASLERVRARFRAWNGIDADADDDAHWHPTCAVTVIETENTSINCIPGTASACLDVRFPAPHTIASMLELIRECLGPGVAATPIIAAEATELSPDPLYVRVTAEVTGVPGRLVRSAGGSDARFLTPHGIPVLMSRPLVGRLHSHDEWIEIESMVQFHRICKTYLDRRFGIV